MANKTKQTQQVVCPCCTHKMLCVTADNGDIIIRCRTCKTDINVSELLRRKTEYISH
jgi:hypothetical protein